MAKYNEVELNLLKERLVQAELAKQINPVESGQNLPDKPGHSEQDESLRQRLGIEGRIIRVFKRQANAPVTKARSKGWLYKEVMQEKG